jgi:acetate---CoA ligase (ADP-forming)
MSREQPSNRGAVERLLRPRSIAIVGISSKPGSAGHIMLGNLTVNNFGGDIHLVGRSGGQIEGRPVLPSIDDLPEGVDLAIFTLPAAGVHDAMAGCVRRKVGSAVVFASGFAEVGEREAQDKLAELARDGGVALLGPNCLGYANSVDGLRINFVGTASLPKIAIGRDATVAIISQSGGLMAHVRLALEARDLLVSYSVSTGNEAGLDLADFIDFFTTDEATRAIVVYVEEVRQPARFLAAAARARAAGKPVLMMHPGRGERAQKAMNSHTGALAGDYAVMRTLVTHAGIALIDTLDELIDTAEILARFPNPPVKGPGILTFSGAYCAIAHDFCDDLGLDLPPLSPATEARLASQLPAFAVAANPLDLTTQPVFQPDLMRIGVEALLNDPNLGSLVISIPTGSPKQAMLYLQGLIAGMQGSSKPLVFSLLGEQSPLPAEFVTRAREHRIILSRSADRSVRAMAKATFYGRAVERARATVAAQPLADLPRLGRGAQPEWRGKQLIGAAGIRIPEGALAGSVDDAVRTAQRVGYPVAMKAQAGALAHKTEAGAVMLGVADEAGVRRAWKMLIDNVQRAQPGLALDGVLVERMAPKGLELVVGAKRDPRWGPVVLVGLGGVWVEAIRDVRLLPPDLDEGAIIAEIEQLRSAPLLHGFRGSPALDIEAVASTAARVGRLMRTVPEIVEIDINPLFAHGKGEGVTAVDALVVAAFEPARESPWAPQDDG